MNIEDCLLFFFFVDALTECFNRIMIDFIEFHLEFAD